MKTCDWCNAPMTTQRADAVCCSVRCRQARHRFARGSGVLPVASGRPLRLAYADPPYPGLSARYYADHEDFAGEVDHAELIRRLSIDFDGWALSTSARALCTAASFGSAAAAAAAIAAKLSAASATPASRAMSASQRTAGASVGVSAGPSTSLRAPREEQIWWTSGARGLPVDPIPGT